VATNLSRAQLRRAVFTHAGAVVDRQHVTRVLGNLFLAIEICWMFGYDDGVHISCSTLPEWVIVFLCHSTTHKL
jgi:hypothetical protein